MTDNKLNTILLIDTTTTACSVAMCHGKEIIAERNFLEDKAQHASLIGVFGKEVLELSAQQGYHPQAVALSAGPGSYTGLRIGTSFAKGICFGYSIPLIPVSTLELLAHEAIIHGDVPEGAWICPMIDARRMEVYTAIFDHKGNRITDDQPLIIDADIYASELQERNIVFVGNGSNKCSQVITHRHAIFPQRAYLPIASQMTELAHKAVKAEAYADVAYWEPHYLKEFVAVVGKNKVLGDL
ncbi:tRNA (adenosine(37)-N6)-threonylcarbamoyltransferase complex dimerization subunit type 1 TsaB [Porphyromonas pogonae]|uniref:tRNA (adenosine(37)-N6)-threonylcarbamoyltransferase complex dimerization subunit type 1 TsaB n=1 Tax=Porphyromonas pogonae TaxID=867595 RepID=UPI002E7A95F8|nr:tRNA (adenosine(37)-N6)-threonylcarbamoyltransferase complex dimerization subunit type 1 TsaB [Porphyromonas pogonae]